jgi:NADPH-dependent glutamate synthase beta subunit-like oxidoreductase/NAD(P)H-flavin reductase
MTTAPHSFAFGPNNGFRFAYEDLHTQAGLSQLDAQFIAWLAAEDVALHNRLVTKRRDSLAGMPLDDADHSDLLLALAPYLETFITILFSVEKEMAALALQHNPAAEVAKCKRLFVQRRAAKLMTPERIAEIIATNSHQTIRSYAINPTEEHAFASSVLGWMQDTEAHAGAHAGALQAAEDYALWALFSAAGQAQHAEGVLFKLPKKLDPTALVPLATQCVQGITMLASPAKTLHERHGFALTDDGGTLEAALDQAHYCIYCHHQGKDSCSKGMREKDTKQCKKNAQGVTLAGCPLEEHISEMNSLKAAGGVIAPLAVVTINNPMVAATGHRICNDCMKACIYQKQDPVNIPQVETRVLNDVLSLPWGFEIYSLLTRWNPLNLQAPLPKPITNKRVLVVGMGPAGFTLAHYLLNEGHLVVGIDGLKIEPLPDRLTAFAPIRDITEYFDSLNDRTPAGFGGVAEYGITVRWNKNYLLIIRLLLERRAQFLLLGGIRFGSTITPDSAWQLGFDHVALAVGAGQPNRLNIPGDMGKGIRMASDFLMALQLSGAAREKSLSNLQIRLPVAVIGGGLTAIDTATEALAYYPVQVEKFLQRYEQLGEDLTKIQASFSAEDAAIAEEFITHAKRIRACRAAGESVTKLLQELGGVTILYRKDLTDAPSYRLNHEEVTIAMEEGLWFLPHATPTAFLYDAANNVDTIVFKNAEGEEKKITARTVLVAAGTHPNTVLAREMPELFAKDGSYFQFINASGNQVQPERMVKPEQAEMLLWRDAEGRAITCFGDVHPSFAGNVVKAMASAKRGYPQVSALLADCTAPHAEESDAFLSRMKSIFTATVVAVHRLTPTIIEVVVHAEEAAKQFQPGQFYRLQNFEHYAPKASIFQTLTPLAMEGLAVTGASVDKEAGLLSTIVLEMGGSSDLVASLQPGEPVMLMGPTGTPTHIVANETVLLMGGGLGNAVLFSIGKALRAAGSRVLYVAGYKSAIDCFKQEEIEAAADQVIWCCDEALLPSRRAGDLHYQGNVVQALVAYGEQRLGEVHVPLQEVNRILAIGSDRMMAAVALAKNGILSPYFLAKPLAIGSINSPMQCMMKEICAQCLQRHIDPITGEESYVFSCFNQDQCLDTVDFGHLQDRLAQNSLQEKLARWWVAQRT